MLNKIWPLFIIISFIYAFFSGNIEKVNAGIFESTKNAVELSITFLGTICLWNGIMKIAYNSKIVEKITFISKKVKENVDNTKTKWYITFRYRKKGANNMLKDLIKKVLKRNWSVDSISSRRIYDGRSKRIINFNA